MNKQAKIQLIRQILSGADLSESRCYILEIGEALPPDYRRNIDRVIWVTDDKGEIKKPTGKLDILIQVTSKETVKQVKKLGDYLDKVADVGKIEPQPTQPAPMPQPEVIPAPTPQPAIIPTPQPRTIPNPKFGLRKTHF